MNKLEVLFINDSAKTKNANWTYDVSNGGYINPETGETISAYSNLSPATGNE